MEPTAADFQHTSDIPPSHVRRGRGRGAQWSAEVTARKIIEAKLIAEAQERERVQAEKAREDARLADLPPAISNEEIERRFSKLAIETSDEKVQLDALSKLAAMRGLGKQPPAPPQNPLADYIEKMKEAATASQMASGPPVFARPDTISTDSKPLEP